MTIVTHFSNRWNADGSTRSSLNFDQLMGWKRETLDAEVSFGQLLQQTVAEIHQMDVIKEQLKNPHSVNPIKYKNLKNNKKKKTPQTT